MKTPNRKLLGLMQLSYVQNMGWMRRFAKRWGVITAPDGTEVLTSRIYVFQQGVNPTVRVDEMKTVPSGLYTWTETDYDGSTVQVAEVSDLVTISGGEDEPDTSYQPEGTATREEAGIAEYDYMNWRVRRLIKFLDSYDSVVESYPKGVKSIWLYLNYNKELKVGSENFKLEVDGDGKYVEVFESLKSTIASKLNVLTQYENISPYPSSKYTFTLDIKPVSKVISNSIGYSASSRSVINTLGVNSTVTPSELLTILRSNREYFLEKLLFANGPREYLEDDPYIDAFSRFAIFDAGLDITIKSIKVVPFKITDVQEIVESDGETGSSTYYNWAQPVVLDGLRVVFEVGELKPEVRTIEGQEVTDIYFNFSTTTNVVEYINDSALIGRPDRYKDSLTVEGSISTIPTHFLTYSQMRAVFTDEDNGGPTMPQMWKYFNNRWHLKTETIFKKTYIRDINQRLVFVQNLIDQGYKKKKKDPLDYVFALFVFVFVFLITKNIYAAWSTATVILVVTVVFTVLSFIAASLGAYELAELFSDAATIGSIASIVNGIYNFASDGFVQAATEELGKKATEEAVTALAADMSSKFVTSMIIQTLNAAGLDIPGIPTSAGDFAYMVAKMSLDMKTESIANKINSTQKQLAKLEQDKEMALMRDRGIDQIRMLYDPLNMEVTSVELDGPYEPISGPYHTGNICKTTVFPMYFGK